MQSLEHTTKTVGRGQRLPMNSLWPSTARTRARKCRMSVETARRGIVSNQGEITIASLSMRSVRRASDYVQTAKPDDFPSQTDWILG
jgi:hypothetical protein